MPKEGNNCFPKQGIYLINHCSQKRKNLFLMSSLLATKLPKNGILGSISVMEREYQIKVNKLSAQLSHIYLSCGVNFVILKLPRLVGADSCNLFIEKESTC